MKWKVFLVLLASGVLSADGQKRRHGNRALNEKWSAASSRTGAQNPLAKESSRNVYIRLKKGNGPTRDNGGIKSATVDASVVAESTGEGGFIVRSRSEKPNILETTDLQSRARSYYHQMNHPGVNLFKSGTVLSQNPQGFLLPQSATGFSPQMFPGYFRPHIGRIHPQAAPIQPQPDRIQPQPSSIQPQAAQIQPQSAPGPILYPNLQGLFPSQQQHSLFMGNAPGPLAAHRFPDMYGTAGGNYGHQSGGAYMDPRASTYGYGAAAEAQTGAQNFPGGMGTYGFGMEMYGTSMYPPSHNHLTTVGRYEAHQK